jgi:hypothetical protein
MLIKPRLFVKKIIGERHYNKLRMTKQICKNPIFFAKYAFTSIAGRPDLPEIGRCHGTDKIDELHSFNGLSYLDIYERYFVALRDMEISVLEIGVHNGASLRTWKSYFRHGKIFGIDIDPRCKDMEEDHIRVEIGSQDDAAFLRNCFGPDAKFDIVIDDGSHVNSFTMASFEYLFNNRLNSRGIYIIEDLACSYHKLQTEWNALRNWPGMGYNDPSKPLDNDRKDMDNFFLEKIWKLDRREGNIQFIHFWPMICVIMKV